MKRSERVEVPACKTLNIIWGLDLNGQPIVTFEPIPLLSNIPLGCFTVPASHLGEVITLLQRTLDEIEAHQKPH